MTTLLEHTSGADRVDRAAGIIRGVKILGKRSQNGREYSPNAMRQAAKLYEGMKVNIDHPEAKKRNGERGIAERAGVLRNVRQKGDAIFGDLHLMVSHPLAGFLLESAERMPETFGLSHNAEGQVRRNGDITIVESVDHIHSVDIVQSPATTAGLFESVQGRHYKPRNSAELVKRLLS